MKLAKISDFLMLELILKKRRYYSIIITEFSVKNRAECSVYNWIFSSKIFILQKWTGVTYSLSTLRDGKIVFQI